MPKVHSRGKPQTHTHTQQARRTSPPNVHTPTPRAPAQGHHAQARSVDVFEAPRRGGPREAPQAAPRKSAASRSQRREQVSRAIDREIQRLPLPAEDRKRLERAALQPGASAEERRAARDLRRVLYSTRSLPPSAQAGLVRPFVSRPQGAEARAAAALVRDQNFRAASSSERELMARVFPSTSPATARGLPAAARQLSQAKLPEAKREQVLRHAFSERSDPDVRLATRDVLRALKNEPQAAQAGLLEPFTRPHIGQNHAQYARELVHSPAWKSLGSTERTQLAQVFGAASNHGLRSIHLLSQQPGRLMDRDSQGGTLLSNLAQLARGPLHAALPESRRAELLDSVLQESSRAELIDQKHFSTCTVTSMQYELARDNPAEFARIMAGLAGPTGRVGMRGGGELELQADALIPQALRNPGDFGGRTLSEALFQTSLMEYANGTDEYRVQGPQGDESIRPDGSTYQGQFASGMVRASSALFGRQYSDWPTYDATRDAQLDFLRNYRPDGPNAPVLISFDMNGDAPGGGHAVTFERMEGDRVFFRNPWGRTQDARGTEVPFGARVEDPATGLYSFSLEQFRERVYGLTVPEEARAFMRRRPLVG